jgi:hypothetical protein
MANLRFDMNLIRQQVFGMMQAGQSNPQEYLQRLLKNNPDFAQMINGRNPQQVLNEVLMRQQINPSQFMMDLNKRN